MNASAPSLRIGTPAGRWLITAAVLGSGVAFLDGTVVNAALPAIANDFDADLAALQWVITAYLLTLGSLLVIGGSLGDLFGRRRVFLIGLVGFGAASLLCGVAPSVGTLIAARAIQGGAAALLVPGSLAIISASFHPDDRARGIGAWSGLAGVASAVGPFLGGWLIDSVSWRAVFLINIPVIVVTILITLRHVPETRDETAVRRVDVTGGALLALGLAGVVYGLIEGPAANWSGVPVVLLAGGVRRAGAVPRRRGAIAQPDGAARRVSLAPVLRRQRRDLRGLRGARCHLLLVGRAPADRPRVLGARSRARRCSRSRCSCCCSRRARARWRNASGRASP